MTGRDAARRWWVGVILGGAILLPLVYSCTEDARLAPRSPFSAPRGDGQAGNPFGPPFQVPVPASNDQGISPVITGIVIPPGVVATVTVTGFLQYTVNAAATIACPSPPFPPPLSPGDLTTVGPAGFVPVRDPRFTGGYQGGEVQVYESTDNNPPPYGIRLQFQPQDPSAGTVTATVTGLPPLGRLWVVRPPSFPSSCGVNAGTPNPTSIPGFLVSGSQTLSADFPGAGGKDSTLKVQLGVSPAAVDPVITQRFNAVTQSVTFRDGSNAPRTDVSQMHLRAFWDPSGHAAAHAQVALFSEPVTGSGAHDHTANRPAGTFFRVGDDVTIPAGGARGRLSFTLPESGDTTLVYRSSGVGGVEHIRADVTAGDRQAHGTDSVVVRLSNPLDEIANSGASYTFVSSHLHSSGDFFLAPGAIDAMEVLWLNFIGNVNAGAARYHMNGSTFRLTAAGLELGGLYDINGSWQVPGHYLHRRGTDVDFSDLGLGSPTSILYDPQLMARHCRKFSYGGYRIVCELHNGNHFHAYLAPQPR